MNQSEIIIGCMTWGKWGKQMTIAEQSRHIQWCVEEGLTSFDHADIYGDYTAEDEFGRALAKSNVQRKDLQLTTKCGIQLVGESRPNTVKHYDLSKDYIIWSAEQSLRLLHTDYLDTFLLHRPSPLMQAEEIAEAITHLQQKGKIKTFCVSNFTPSQVEMLNQYIDVSINQVEISLTQPQAFFDGTLDQMQQKGIRAQAWSPLGGIYKTENDQNQRIKPLLTRLSQKYEAEESSLLLAWLLKHPIAISPVIGTTNTVRIKMAKRALDIELELEDWYLLLQASMGHEVP